MISRELLAVLLAVSGLWILVLVAVCVRLVILWQRAQRLLGDAKKQIEALQAALSAWSGFRGDRR
jgi:hypothetical protein